MLCSWSYWQFTVTIGFLLINGFTDAQEMDGPIIYQPPKNEIILNKGDNYTILCKGKSKIQILQQEIPEEVVGNFKMIEKSVVSPDEEYEFETALELYNVDQFAIGFYACFDAEGNDSEVLNNFRKEPQNTNHVSYVYIYVNGTDNLFAPMKELVPARKGSEVIIDCRPTTPDIKVDLLLNNKIADFIDFSPKIGFLVKVRNKNEYECKGHPGRQSIWKRIRFSDIQPPKPTIKGVKYFLRGDTFSLNCTARYQKNSALSLQWTYPRKGVVISETNLEKVPENEKLYNNITITNATEDDKGIYTCITQSSSKLRENATFEKILLEKPFINLTKETEESKTDGNIETSKRKSFTLLVGVISYPAETFQFLKDGKPLVVDNNKYISGRAGITNDLTFKIMDLRVNDSGDYTFLATNKYNISSSVTYKVRVRSGPAVDFETAGKYLINTRASLLCEATGYPPPNITWIFEDFITKQRNTQPGEIRQESLYKVRSTLNMPVISSGNIICKASNELNSTETSRQFLVYEIRDGFGIKDSDKTWFPEKQSVTKTCLASKYDFVNLTWFGQNDDELGDMVELEEDPLSYVANLKFNDILMEHAGNYTCRGYRNDGSEQDATIQIQVEARRSPKILEPSLDKDVEVEPYSSYNFTCLSDAVPAPQIEWRKNGVQLFDNIETTLDPTTHTIVNSTLTIPRMKQEDVGKYECIATREDDQEIRFFNIAMTDTSPHKTMYLSVIGAIILVLIILIVYLAWKIRKEKQFRQELAKAGLLYFKEGVTRSINPEIGIDEQAELLPYDEKFEFPPEKLKMGAQLGAGAFGVVYKAEARGIIDAEKTTPVAVKMVKKTADNMYIKALASELKIMVHLGKHVNIVNLLGACTKNVGKRELIVIVEYCKFGNIHNYMQKHREVFIDQLTDNKEKSLGNVNRGFSCSSGSGMQSDYFGSNHTQETDHTFLNTSNTNRSGRKDNANKQVDFVKVSETGYVQPEWRSNYESDYSYDGRSPRPLCSRDLLAWSFQIARGMEYLASRKVLHGDLAARNVLLADDNIVKICDFGLARSIYKNDEYLKKENSPLPVKWLAIECMTDRIFSTQSDVWSFGIVLWEIFSLAKTPYPNISPTNLLSWLSEGNRLEKPSYADDRLYNVMMRCWELKPNMRPSFSNLQELLGSFLEDNVRNHYVDLNSAYMDMNVRPEGQEDYLAMVCAPDYNNMVTPSPHHYVNDRSFFPPTPTPLQYAPKLEQDDEGYLQMSPATNSNVFSPRPQGTKFDFDARKLNPRSSEANSYGSESTPMLTLNNLPARTGSDSDHEGNSSPYLNMCPRIEEEDEVFETKQNAKNIQNSVTNPIYITYDDEKKSQDINKHYMNVNLQNGLVK